jgi:hypothetical protein
MGTIYQSNTNFPIDNVFNIDNPEQYLCIVGQYQASLSRLEIAVAKQPGFQIAYRIVFNGLVYLDAPTRWKGARFCVPIPEECIELAHSFEAYQNLAPDDVLEHLVLYVVDTDDRRVRILAATGRISEQDD